MSSIKRTGSKKTGAIASPRTGVDKNRPATGSAGIEEDRLEVSAEAQKIDELFQQLADVDEVNSARVESIRKSLKKGNFPIDYQQLADKILELSDELNRDDD